MPRLVPAAAVLVATLAVPLEGQPKPEVWLPRLQAWLAAVETHTPGRKDAAAFLVGQWVNSDVDLISPYVEGLIEVLPPQKVELRLPRRLTRADREALEQMAAAIRSRIDGTTLAKRAAMLHADVMMSGLAKDSRHLTEAEARAEARAGGRIIVLGKDGQPQGFAVPPRHWEFARLLLDRLWPAPIEHPFVRQWYRSTTAYLFFDLRWAELKDHLEFARRTLGPDAPLEFATGCVHETLASPSITSVADAMPRLGARASISGRSDNLEKAEEAFRESVRLDPTFAEARVRLGAVVAARGRAEEAVGILEPVAARGEDATVRYFAALFLGEALQTLGRRDAAADAFTLAASLFPRAQSPHLALSALAIEHADRAAALRAVQRVLDMSRAAGDRDDPWWKYRIGPGRYAQRLLEELWTASKAGRR